MELPKIWNLFPGLARVVKEAHERVGLTNGGHDFDHALRVAQMALRVAWPEDQEFAKLAGASGLLHNNDRILERELRLKSENISRVEDVAVVAMTQVMLSGVGGFSEEDGRLIIEAVVNHGSKPNSFDDHLVSVALADADRLINMEPDVIIRSAQHHADILSLDPVYIEASPGANYRDPKTVAWDVANCITWSAETGPYIVRLPLARELAQERASYLREFLAMVKRMRADLGLYPDYPTEI